MLAELPFWILALLTLVGIVAGFVDTLAGGGGMLTIPSLLLAGLPPDDHDPMAELEEANPCS